MQEIQTRQFYIYSSAYEFQVPARRKLWEKFSWGERTLYYSALSDLNLTGWTVTSLTGAKPRVTVVIHRGKIVGFLHMVTDGYKKAFVLALLFPLQQLGIDERLEGDPS